MQIGKQIFLNKKSFHYEIGHSKPLCVMEGSIDNLALAPGSAQLCHSDAVTGLSRLVLGSWAVSVDGLVPFLLSAFLGSVEIPLNYPLYFQLYSYVWKESSS